MFFIKSCKKNIYIYVGASIITKFVPIIKWYANFFNIALPIADPYYIYIYIYILDLYDKIK